MEEMTARPAGADASPHRLIGSSPGAGAVPEHNDILLLIGHGSKDAQGVAENRALAERLAERLRLPVETAFLEFADPPLIEGIAACAAREPRRVLALPLFLGAAGHQKNDVPVLIELARRRWPAIEFRYGVPLGAQHALVEALADRAAALAGTPELSETALLVVGRGSRDPESNSEVYKVARLLWEGRGYGWVETAFHSLTGPGVAAGIERCARLGARRVIVLPYLLFAGRICRTIGEQAIASGARFPGLEVLVAEHLGLHDGVLAAVEQRYQEIVDGTAAMTCDLCKYRNRFPGFEAEYGMPQRSDHQHGLRGVAHTHGVPSALDVLPPRYRNNQPSAAPMSAAPLVYDAEGRVDWARVWGGGDPNNPFCELALAGGPPHRGALLEPIAPDIVQADMDGYARVLDELERGIFQTTGLRAIERAAPGWIGVRCDSEEMAIWLLRAIVVENIAVRREGATIFLPAGPQFRIDGEIRNVVTALAKTHHYWQEHLMARGTR
jgi:sirohydrochlorin cobaltochelatase